MPVRMIGSDEDEFVPIPVVYRDRRFAELDRALSRVGNKTPEWIDRMTIHRGPILHRLRRRALYLVETGREEQAVQEGLGRYLSRYRQAGERK